LACISSITPVTYITDVKVKIWPMRRMAREPNRWGVQRHVFRARATRRVALPQKISKIGPSILSHLDPIFSLKNRTLRFLCCWSSMSSKRKALRSLMSTIHAQPSKPEPSLGGSSASSSSSSVGSSPTTPIPSAPVPPTSPSSQPFLWHPTRHSNTYCCSFVIYVC
jgi:hypothetical protein